MLHKKLNIVRGFLSFAALAVLLSALGNFSVYAAESGKCGSELKWSCSAGTLTISGKGDMTDFSEANPAPWQHLSDKITAVSLGEGLTSVGKLAFYNCASLKAISIPDTVKEIDDKAFYGCKKLRLVELSDSLTSIGRSAFYACEELESVSLPLSLEKIGDKAFYLCRSLVTITVPQNAKTLGNQIFAYCEGLIRVEINAPITTIPEWTFYGCSSLAEIKLPETVTEIGDYAFRRCEELYSIYHSGSQQTVKSVREQIAEDLPSFKNGGYVGGDEMQESTQSSDVKTDKDDKLSSQTNTTVLSKPKISLVTVINTTRDENGRLCYTAHLTLTVEGEDSWDEAINAVRSALKSINDSYSLDGELKSVTLTIYLKNTDTVNEDFLKELAGRNISIEVVTASGSVWRIDCQQLEKEEIKKDTGFSYTVTEATDKSCKKLGTEDCYQVTFKENAKLNTNVLIQLPDSVANTNAFLYQVGWNGKHTKLQSSVVDSDGNAHFYISSVSKKTKYVVGINVPGESVDDAIIPNELSDVYGAIARLEKIDYVSADQRTFGGFTFPQILMMVLGLLVFLAITVGIVMYMLNKRKIALGYSGSQYFGKLKGGVKKASKLFSRKNKDK